MRSLSAFALFCLLSILSVLPVAAQEVLPAHRYLYTQDVDFFGADLTTLFDTTPEACARACSAQNACVAFTFNARNNACFPKSALTERQPYDGALSARKIPTDAAALRGAETRRAEARFLSDRDIAAATSFAGQMARRHPLTNETLEDILTGMAGAEQRGEPARALRWAGQAVALSDRADLWTAYARLAVQSAQKSNTRQSRQLRNEALWAAINGHLRATTSPLQGEALRVMAQALEASRRGRDMIPALRLATAIAPRDDLDAALDDAIGKYGFRIIEHTVENAAAAPRICASFSEDLIQAGTDYEPFVRVEGRGLVVAAQDQQICIDGVTHGAGYDVTFRAGLPAASGEVLHKDVRLQLYVRDRPPSARFAGRSYVLPRSAEAALPVETVNTSELALRLRRVSDRNLVRAIRESYFGQPLNIYEDERFARDLAVEVWTGEAQVQNALNVEMTTRLPLGEALTDQPPGIYALSAAVPGQDPYETAAAMQWFVLSDLGLSTWSGTDGLHVAVRRLGDAGAKGGVTVSLISQANAVLGTAVTDADGFAHFPPGLSRGQGAARPALLMAEEAGIDLAFMALTDPAFDLSDRGVEGHPPAPPIDTFLTTDRGAYRVGETIYATALTRDAQARAFDGLPVTAVLKRPDGAEYSRQLSQNAKSGGHVFALPLGAEVPRGAWRLDIFTDLAAPALASQVVLVEDFVPERIDFEMSVPGDIVRLGQTPPLDVAVQYLFGAPGADLTVRGDARLKAVRALAGWEGYQFGRHDAPFATRTQVLEDAVTGADGKATLSLILPKVVQAPTQPLKAEVILRVTEGSGRAVERRMTLPVASQSTMIGIKPRFDDVLSEGAEAGFDLIVAAPAGRVAPMPARWTVNRVETRYQWYQLQGNWEWEPVTRRTRVDTGDVTLTGEPVAVSVPTQWGQYEIVVEHLGQPYAAASVPFTAGWHSGDGARDTPDRLVMSLDAEGYRTGDKARLKVVADAAGTAIVSVLSNKIIERRVLPVAAGENEITLDVTPDWGSGAYVSATVLRGMNAQAGLNPSRQLGLAHATVDPEGKALNVHLAVPDAVDGQAGTLRASVQVDGVAPGETAYVTLAAVDVGILNLTGFTPPDVSDHYFGQRRLGVELRDIYGRLIDGLNGALGTVRSGGDVAAAAQVQSPPPTQKLMAFFSGPITVGPDGRAVVEIIKPAFNGTIKLMAVAWTDRAVGDATLDVVAKDPVVVTASVPRFLAPQDESRLRLELVHSDGPAGAMQVEVFADAGVALGAVPAEVVVTAQGTARLDIPVTGREIGDHLIAVVIRTPDGKELRKVLTLPVRDNDPEVAITRQFSLAPGETFTFDSNVFAGLRLGTGSATLTAGPLARFDVPGLLGQLDRYPYGCTEQVTSTALPLLYLSAVAASAGIGGPQDIDKKIASAITRVLARQSSNGAFGLWQSGSGEFWLDAYVTDFLAQARSQGHQVPDLAFRLAMDNLRNRISYAPDFDKGGEDIAYALLVLAREGAAQMGDLRYYADTKAVNFATPLAVAQLGAALAAYGDPVRADAMFRRAGVMLGAQTDRLGWRSDFGSALRDTAGVLQLTAEAGSTALDPANLTSLVHNRTARLSPQEAAQLLLAAHAVSGPGAAPGLRVNGQAALGPVIERLSDVAPRSSAIENVSDAAMDVTMTAYGVPDVAPAADGVGYKITRRYFTMDGAPAQGPFLAGDRLAVVIEVTPFEEIGARLMINDPLPAGFEIDNPNLLRSGEVAALDWLKTKPAETAEFRSDRFLAAVDHREAAPFSVAYVVRAVSPGVFHHPAASVEDMYRPEYRANTDSGGVTITP